MADSPRRPAPGIAERMAEFAIDLTPWQAELLDKLFAWQLEPDALHLEVVPPAPVARADAWIGPCWLDEVWSGIEANERRLRARRLHRAYRSRMKARRRRG